MTIIWCMVPEIWSVTDKIFLSFWTIFCPLTPLRTQKIKILKKWKKCLKISSFSTSVPKIMIIYYITDVSVIFHLGYFLPFYPHNNSKNQNLKKNGKTPCDIMILHMCTKNHDHMLCGSWDMVCNGCKCYFSFWAIFCPFSSLIAWKIKI